MGNPVSYDFTVQSFQEYFKNNSLLAIEPKKQFTLRGFSKFMVVNPGAIKSNPEDWRSGLLKITTLFGEILAVIGKTAAVKWSIGECSVRNDCITSIDALVQIETKTEDISTRLSVFFNNMIASQLSSVTFAPDQLFEFTTTRQASKSLELDEWIKYFIHPEVPQDYSVQAELLPSEGSKRVNFSTYPALKIRFGEGLMEPGVGISSGEGTDGLRITLRKNQAIARIPDYRTSSLFYSAHAAGLTALDLSQRQLDDTAIRHIFMKNHPNLHTLNLEGNKLVDPSFSLKRLTTLTDLNLRYNQIGIEGFESLLFWFKNPQLTALRLAYNQIQDEEFSPKVRDLKKFPALRLLNLVGDDNELGFLPEQDLQTTTSLNLKQCQLTNRKIALLAEMLHGNTVLTELDLSWNRFDDGAEEPLSKLCHTSLVSLNLEGNWLAQPSSLYWSLKNCTSLTSLQLSHNELVSNQVSALILWLEKRCLVALGLANNQIDKDAVEKLRYINRTSPSLTSLKVCGNNFSHEDVLAIELPRPHLNNKLMTTLRQLCIRIVYPALTSQNPVSATTAPVAEPQKLESSDPVENPVSATIAPVAEPQKLESSDPVRRKKFTMPPPMRPRKKDR